MNDRRRSATTALLTPWLDGSLRPARQGVYGRDDDGYSCWDGRLWRAAAVTPAEASRQTVAGPRPRRWRGLARPSESTCATCRGDTVIDHGLHPERAEDRITECPDC
ncbi:MAG: hypothetical protein ABI641_09095 [Caldimonas sp.]